MPAGRCGATKCADTLEVPQHFVFATGCPKRRPPQHFVFATGCPKKRGLLKRKEVMALVSCQCASSNTLVLLLPGSSPYY